MFGQHHLAGKLSAIAIGITAALGAVLPASAATIYGVTRNGILLAIDETTGAGRPIREQLAPQFRSIDSLEFVDGHFYASYQGGRILRFGFADGDEVDLGSSGFPYVEQLAERSDGTLFASVSQNFDVAAESVGQLDLNTGKVSNLVSSADLTTAWDLDAISFDADDTLYGINLEDPRTLFSFDVTDGTISHQASLSHIYWALAIEPESNTFFAANGHSTGLNSLSSELFVIDPTTGTETFVGQIGYANVTGLTSVADEEKVSVPEPTSVFALLVFAAVGGMVKRFSAPTRKQQ